MPATSKKCGGSEGRQSTWGGMMALLSMMMVLPDERERRKSSRDQTCPGWYAEVDNQGNTATCTRYGLGKALANGFMEKKFVPGREIDIDQQKITEVLVNEHKVCKNQLETLEEAAKAA